MPVKQASHLIHFLVMSSFVVRTEGVSATLLSP